VVAVPSALRERIAAVATGLLSMIQDGLIGAGNSSTPVFDAIIKSDIRGALKEIIVRGYHPTRHLNKK
jgi:hypothetical protein